MYIDTFEIYVENPFDIYSPLQNISKSELKKIDVFKPNFVSNTSILIDSFSACIL